MSQTIEQNEDLSTLATALDDLGIDIDEMVDEVIGTDTTGSFTFFAPNNEAMDAMQEAEREALLADQEMFRDFLRHSLINRAVYSVEFVLNPAVNAVDGTVYELSQSGDEMIVTNLADGESATVVMSDVITDEGVMQVLDAVLDETEQDVEGTTTPSVTPEGTTSPTPEGTTSPTPEGTTSPTPEGTTSPTPEGTTSPTPEGTVEATATATPFPIPTSGATPVPTASG